MTQNGLECSSFEALYFYEPTERGDIGLNVGDICYVQNPIDNLQGWLEGLNHNTNEHGRFPGTFCRLISSRAKIPLPPRPTRDTKAEKAPDTADITTAHSIEKYHFTKPIWCYNCNSYIWGGDQISISCSVCHLTTHLSCASLFESPDYPCDQSKQYLPYPMEEVRKSIMNWTCDDVLEWMAAAHMHPYMHFFRSQQISGEMLKDISAEDLKSFGIKIDLHVKLLRLCIDELLKPCPSEKEIENTKVNFHDNDVLHTHGKLIEHTFTSAQNCDVCSKNMFGIFRQGLMCADCSFQCHPNCAYAVLQACDGLHQHRRRPSDSEDPSFCCNFLSENIPPVMEKCIARIDEAGLVTPDIYDTDVPFYKCQALRSACNEDVSQVKMEDPYWSDPRCAAYVLKSFLMELPDPLLDLTLYERFIELTERNEYTLNDITTLLKLQSDHSKKHLDHILSHCVRLSKYNKKNKMTISRLASIFSILLVRPPEHDARKYVTNWEKHEKVVELLLMANSNNNDKSAWLWEEATKLDAQSRLSNAPDGAYLVRASQERRGQYTLVVKDNEKDRLIRIITIDGFYGFNAEHLTFPTLKQLIEHYQVHSLKKYNKELDIKLMYPYGKPDNNNLLSNNDDGEEIKVTYDQVDKRLKEIKLLEFETADKLAFLEECKAMSESQTDIVRFLEEQLSLAQQQHNEANSRDKQDIVLSLQALNDLLVEEKKTWGEVDNQLLVLQREYNVLNTKFTELSPEIPALEEEYNTLHTKIKSLDEKHAHDSEIEDWKGIYDDPSVLRNERRIYATKEELSIESIGELEEKDWYIREPLTRPVIQAMLTGKPNGTFVVRNSDHYPYVISLVYEGVVKHVPILRGENGYGFAEPHNVYKTLHELINHYHNQSLRMHNKELDTTLKIPLGLIGQQDNEPIYS